MMGTTGFDHSRRIHNRAWLVEYQLLWWETGKMRSLTSRDVEHISVVLFWGDRQTLFCSDKCLEQSNGRTVNIASNERYPDALVPGHALQVTDEIVSFPLHEPDLKNLPPMNIIRVLPYGH